MSWTGKDICIRVIDKNDARIRDVLASRLPGVRFVARASEASGLKILLSFRPPDDEPVEAYDWVHSAGAGVDHLCRAVAGSGNAPLVTRTTGRMGQQIGEYCLAYALAHFQRVPAREQLQAQRRWQASAAKPRYLFEARVAVFGTGSIGSGIARAFGAMGADVTGYSRRGAPAEAFTTVRPLPRFASDPAPDILVMALPATRDTQALVGEATLSRLQNALLINVGRGSTLEPFALRAALEEGHLDRAVLDVFEAEPLASEDWRWSHPKVTVTPHVSGLTLPDDAANALCDMLETFIKTAEKPISVDVRRGY